MEIPGDGIDNDCNGQTDQPTERAWFRDADGDGFGLDADTVQAETQPDGYTFSGGDCNDTDETVYPNACDAADGKDNDCDGQVDEAVVRLYRDRDYDGYGDAADAGFLEAKCSPNAEGFATNNLDCNDQDEDIHTGAVEQCDGKDNDCDGQVDEGCNTKTWYSDADNDGYGDPANSTTAVTQPEGYVANARDCNDIDANINPDAVEVCDGRDNNCDGVVDGSCSGPVWHLDFDGDGYGDPAEYIQSENQPENYVADSTDCNDGDGDTNPGAAEVCDGVDNNCNGQVDEDCSGSKKWYQDKDGDNYGNPGVFVTSKGKPKGYVKKAGDCNDNDKDIHPNGPSICDGKDNDCDGFTDEKCAGALTWYQDKDKDGYGNPAVPGRSTVQPAGYVSDRTDCNDNDSDIHPNGPSLCDGKDNDCDGLVDEKCGVQAVASGGQLQISALPNPTTNHFTLRLQSTSNTPVEVRIINEMGKVVEVRRGVGANGTLTIGHHYRSGIYYVEVVQDGKRTALKLLKATR